MAYLHGLEEQPGPLDEMMFMLTLLRESPRKVPKLVMAVVSAQLAEDEADPRLGLLDIGHLQAPMLLPRIRPPRQLSNDGTRMKRQPHEQTAWTPPSLIAGSWCSGAWRSVA
jgi:hypothetical protein